MRLNREHKHRTTIAYSRLCSVWAAGCLYRDVLKGPYRHILTGENIYTHLHTNGKEAGELKRHLLRRQRARCFHNYLRQQMLSELMMLQHETRHVWDSLLPTHTRRYTHFPLANIKNMSHPGILNGGQGYCRRFSWMLEVLLGTSVEI